MDDATTARGIAAARAVASDRGLVALDAATLQNTNKLVLRLLPCDVVARVTPAAHNQAFEIAIAAQLRDSGSPVGVLAPGVEPRVYRGDDLSVTLWTYYDPLDAPPTPSQYADALAQLHAGMRTVRVESPHFMDRVSSAVHVVTSVDVSPDLADDERDLLLDALRGIRGALGDAPEQLLHGEPHPGNVLNTADGVVFVDLETCCRGPVEFDLAHIPEDAADAYDGADRDVVEHCRRVVLAMVAAWRFERDDQFPNRLRVGKHILDVLRGGPPWPTLGDLRNFG